jgi:hypothetical protein
MRRRDSLVQLLLAVVCSLISVHLADAQATKPATDTGKSVFEDDGKTPAKKGKPAAPAEQDNQPLPPVPDAAARQQADQLVHQVYKADFAAAINPASKAALGVKLLKAGEETKNDLPGKYALLANARDTAREGYDLDTALKAIDELDETFKLDALAMKRDLFAMSAKSTLSFVARSMLGHIPPLIDEAIAADRYDVAKDLADSAMTSARNAQDGALLRSANGAVQDVTFVEQSYKAATAVQATLDKNSADADASWSSANSAASAKATGNPACRCWRSAAIQS